MWWKSICIMLPLIFSCTPESAPLTSSKIPEPVIPFNPKTYLCTRTETPLNIDGRLNEPAWQAAAWTDDFQDIEGPLKAVPIYRTRAKMLWDDDCFYIAAELEEPHIWATLKKHDSIIFYDNDFEVFIDPDGDTHEYYELEVNAFGTAWDLFLTQPYRDGGKAVFFWDIRGLKVGVHVDGSINNPRNTDKGWQVEIALPWAVLKECAPEARMPEPGEQWRVNFSRVEWKVDIVNNRYVKRKDPESGNTLHEDNWVWSPQGVINMHYPEMWGLVQFSGLAAGGTEDIVLSPAETMKWELRRIYYRQKGYHEAHGKYAESFSALGMAKPELNGFRFAREMESSGTAFEAACSSNDRSLTWTIQQDGRIRNYEQSE